MDFLDYIKNGALEFSNNYTLICAISAWLIAQILKGITGAYRKKSFDLIDFIVGCGGMPSSHSAAVMALAIGSFLQYGVGSFQFTVSIVLAIIVMRDASGVRKETGEQAKIINQIAKEMSDEKESDIEADLKELIGHTPLQVFIGAILGCIVPFIYWPIML